MSDDVTMKYRLVGEDVSASKSLEGVADAVDETGKRFEGLKKTAVAGALGAGVAAGGVLASGFAQNLEFGTANSKLKAQLGLSEADSAKAGAAAGAIYADNWGGSIDDVNEALKSVSDNLGGIAKQSEADLKSTTEAALALSDAFGVDVSESSAAAAALIKNGLAKDSKEAFDIVTAGFQSGADKAGDFTDTLTEYSPQFAKLGLSGTEALALLQDGLKAGARDTDTIADAFKEFSLRAIDGSKGTAQAYKDIGLNAKDTAEAIAKGGSAANGATKDVIEHLAAIKDPLKQNQAGVALFGTQWEDTLRQILPAIKGMADAQDTTTGSTDQMMAALGDNGPAKIESAKRAFETWTMNLVSAKGPMGDVAAGVMAFGGSALSAASSVGMLAAGIGRENIAKAASATWSATVTAAQWLWNAALSANPIGLVVIAIAALVAGLIWFFTQTKLGQQIWASAMSAMSSGFNSFMGVVRTVLAWITSAWNAQIDLFRNAPGKVSGAFSSMFNGLRDGFRAAINFIVRGWNSLHFGIPGFSFAGISVPGINIGVPQIPYLARGGIVTGPTLAMVGEGGQAEAVVPLDRASEFGFGGRVENHFHFPNSVIGSADDIVRAVDEAYRSTGRAGYGLGPA